MNSPIAYSISETCAAAHESRTGIYKAIREGRLRADQARHRVPVSKSGPPRRMKINKNGLHGALDWYRDGSQVGAVQSRTHI